MSQACLANWRVRVLPLGLSPIFLSAFAIVHKQRHLTYFCLLTVVDFNLQFALGRNVRNGMMCILGRLFDAGTLSKIQLHDLRCLRNKPQETGYVKYGSERAILKTLSPQFRRYL